MLPGVKATCRTMSSPPALNRRSSIANALTLPLPGDMFSERL
jgi:hypothetical protein